MLNTGSSKNDCDCDFPLHHFLVVSGGVGLCLIVMEVLARYVVQWILEDSKITPIEKKILTGLKILGFVLAFIQWAALIAGSILVFYNYRFVSFDKKLATTPGQIYCDYSMFMFSLCLVTMIWLFVLLGFFCFAYIYYGLRQNNN